MTVLDSVHPGRSRFILTKSDTYSRYEFVFSVHKALAHTYRYSRSSQVFVHPSSSCTILHWTKGPTLEQRRHNPVPPSSKHIISISVSIVTSPLWSSCLPPIWCLWLYWAHLDNPGPSAPLKILKLTTSSNSPLLCKMTYSQLWGIKMWTTCGGGVHHTVHHKW